MTLILTAVAVATLLILSQTSARLEWYWLTVTLFIAASATAWLCRYRGRAWESMRVVETVVVEPDGEEVTPHPSEQ